MPKGNAAIVIAALLGAAVIIDFGVRSTKQAFASVSAGGQMLSPVTTTGGKTYGQVSYDQVAAIGQKKGWSVQQIDDWFYKLIPSESNGTLTDTNSTTGAYGIAQGITGPSWYRDHGGDAGTVTGQLTAQANYIQSRYGNPSAAWSFHKQHNWY